MNVPAELLASPPPNRCDRAAVHLRRAGARVRADLLDGYFKIAGRLLGGQVWPMAQASVARPARARALSTAWR